MTQDERKIERKSHTLKEANLEGNRIRGAASVMGVVDHGGDVIFPGAFKDAIPGFKRAGFVPVGHDWYDLPVAMPLSAKEDGSRLMVEAEFHDTPRAKDARTVAIERLGKGLEVGLSIGFLAGTSTEFDDGAALLEFLDDNEIDSSLFDVKGIGKYKKPIRGIHKIDELFEFSIVSVPMNPLAIVTEAKHLITEIQSEREFEAWLKGEGFSRKASSIITAHGFKALLRQRDAGDDEAEDAGSAGVTSTPDPPDPALTPGASETPAPEATDAPDESTSKGREETPLVFSRTGRVAPWQT